MIFAGASINDAPVSTYVVLVDPESARGRRLVTIEARFAVGLGGPEAWAIADDAGNVLTKRLHWIYEPLPSGRTNAFRKRARFGSAQEALDTWLRYCASHELSSSPTPEPKP